MYGVHELVTPLGRRASVYLRRDAGAVAQAGVVAIGQFDGVHRGHQALLGEALRQASATGAAAGAVTFDQHPMALLRPDREPPALTGLPEKVDLLLAAGLDFVVVLRVEPELLATEAEVFVDDVLVAMLGVSAVVVGPNFRFGCRAAGDPEMLMLLGASRGFDVRCPALSRHDGAVISSTRIRAAVAAGDLEGAAAMLGRPLPQLGEPV